MYCTLYGQVEECGVLDPEKMVMALVLMELGFSSQIQ